MPSVLAPPGTPLLSLSLRKPRLDVTSESAQRAFVLAPRVSIVSFEQLAYVTRA